MGKFRTAQFFLENGQAETGMNALIQYAAQLIVSFNDQYLFQSFIITLLGSCQTGRTAADNNYIKQLTSPSIL